MNNEEYVVLVDKHDKQIGLEEKVATHTTHPRLHRAFTLLIFNEQGELPITIDVAETKPRSISVGASYQTTFGAGASFEWENRNIGGMGRRFCLQADIAQRGHS